MTALIDRPVHHQSAGLWLSTIDPPSTFHLLPTHQQLNIYQRPMIIHQATNIFLFHFLHSADSACFMI